VKNDIRIDGIRDRVCPRWLRDDDYV